MQQPQINLIEDQQQPIAQKTQSRRLLKSIKEKQSNFKFFNWDVLQNYAYIAYLTNFRFVFQSSAERKRIRVFHHISNLIKTRNAHQIKSHHQKMLMRHKSIDEIVEFVRYKITKELACSPELIPKIEEINIQAEEFFLNAQKCKTFVQSQPKRVTRKPSPGQSQPKRVIRLPSPKKTATNIKKEQNQVSYEMKVKKEQNDSGSSESSEVYCLQEEEQDMILRV